MIKDARIKLIKMITAAVLCFVVFSVIISLVQTNSQIKNQGLKSEAKLKDTIEVLADRQAQASLEYREYDDALVAKADLISYMVKNDPDYDFSEANMQKLKEVEDIDGCWIIDPSGNILASADTKDKVDFSLRRFKQLLTAFSNGTSEPFTIDWDSGSLRYCGAKIDDDRMFVIAQDPSSYIELIENITSVENNIKNISIGNNGFVFSIKKLTNTIETYPGNTLIDASAYEVGLKPENLRNGFKGLIKINDTSYFCATNAEDEDRYLLAVVPYSEMMKTNRFMVISSLIILMIAIVLLITYGIMVWNYGLSNPDLMEVTALKHSHKKFINKYILRKMMPVVVIIFTAVFLVSFFLQTLYFISNTAVSNNQHTADIKATISGYDEKADLLDENYNNRYLIKCKIGAYIIEQCPQLLTNAGISELAEKLSVKNAYYFNVQGESTVSSASHGTVKLSDKKEDQSNAFWTVLSGGQDYFIQEMTIDDNGTLNQYIGAAVYDENNVVKGMLQIAMSGENREFNLALLDINSSLASIKVGNNGIVFAVNSESETKEITYHPDENLIGKSAYGLGMTDNEFTDGYSDFITFDGQKYFASSAEIKDNYLYIAVPEREIGRTRLVIVGITLVVSLLIFTMLVLILVISNRDDVKEVRRAVEDKDENSVYFNCVREDGTVNTISSVESRFSLRSPKWNEKTPEQKLLVIVNLIFGIIAVIICIFIWFRESLFYKVDESILVYIMNGGWENNFNIFSLTNVIIMVMFVNMAAVILRKLFMLIARNSNQRGETIGRLMCGIIKYAAIIISVFNALRIFGVDTSTLMTSAGLLSLIVGLGAQSLISDLIAGLFIVFEGEFRVGDIITVDGFRGTVVEIGLRTTKIEDATHNIKVLNNSKISGVLNMTRKFSVASCEIGIEYGESIERVEDVLARELPSLCDTIPDIVSVPKYLGVVALADSSVNIKITAECPENKRAAVERALMRGIKIIFDRNNINVPFPQIVLNQPVEFEPYNPREKNSPEKEGK